jgi:tetratricopeptide (TPR) repeat protein
LEDAYFTARAAGDSDVASTAAAALAAAVAEQTQDGTSALRWARLALVEASDDEGRLVAENGRAFALYEAGRFPEALAAFEAALELSRATCGESCPFTADLLGNIATTLVQLGRAEEALARAQESLTLIEALHGPDHPDVASGLKYVGDTLDMLGRDREAVPLLERAVSIRERTFGPDHPDVASALGSLASVVQDLGDLPRARAMLERVIAIVERGGAPGDLAAVYNALGLLLAAEGEHAAAIAAYERAAASLDGGSGADHPWLAYIEGNLGNALESAGRKDEAEVVMRRAIGRLERLGGREDQRLSAPLTSLCGLLVDSGRAREAIEHCERVLAIGSDDRERIGDAEARLAQALVASGGDRTRALELARAALARLRTLDNAGAKASVASIERWLREQGG